MLITSLAIALIMAVYSYLVIRCSAKFARAANDAPPMPAGGLPQADIIVAARNEQANMQALITTMRKQKNIASELILVDDHSTDCTPQLARQLMHPGMQLLSSPGRGKKEAIQHGIAHSHAPYILFTDADCLPGGQWAAAMVGTAMSEGADVVMAPVIIEPANPKSLFQRLQLLESFALITITGGTCMLGRPVMCNGGNIAYRAQFLKAARIDLKKQYASGDDMFMMESGLKAGSKFAYAASPMAAMRTAAEPTWRRLINQRARWVSKSGGYTSPHIIFFALVILLGNLAALAAPFLYVSSLMPLFLLALAGKLVSDAASVYASAGRYGCRASLIDVLLLELVYPYYVAASVISCMVRGFAWK